MKKTRLLGSVVLATGLFATAPLATLSSCAPGGGQVDEKIVTLRSVNLSKTATSVFTADAVSTSNDSEDIEPTLWETELVEGQLVLSEVKGEDEQGEIVTISPD
ncbi:MAG: hypothetical protein MJ233_04895 [Mycoplasmoidaceae bacterium]|nr:hypothetical protein [Mycoplasmoidaceae bacterium]